MTREEFMDIVYYELDSDDDNYRANRIIDAADEYAKDSSSEKSNKWIYVSSGKLPKKEQVVLVTFGDTTNECDVAYIQSNGEWISASMSLPLSRDVIYKKYK